MMSDDKYNDIPSDEEWDSLMRDLTPSNEEWDRLMQDLTPSNEEWDRLMQDLTLSDEDGKSLMQDLTPSDEEWKNLLEDLKSPDSEFNVEWPEDDLVSSIDPGQVVIKSETLPEPDPNLTSRNVADWMLEQVKSRGMLEQKHAAWTIRRQFGKRFIYTNKNGNLAIATDVLQEFLRISFAAVVWNRRERLWRLRTPDDPINKRRVDD